MSAGVRRVRFADNDEVVEIECKQLTYSQAELDAAFFWTADELKQSSEYPRFVSEQRFRNTADSHSENNDSIFYCTRGLVTPDASQRRYQCRQDIAEAVLAEQEFQRASNFVDQDLVAAAAAMISRRHVGEALRRGRLWYAQEQAQFQTNENKLLSTYHPNSRKDTGDIPLRGGSRARLISKSRVGGNRLFGELRNSNRIIRDQM